VGRCWSLRLLPARLTEGRPSLASCARRAPTDLYGCETPAVIACHAFGGRDRAATRANTMRVSISHGLSPCQPRTIMTNARCAE
jgi:hypothetical protein